MTEIIELLPSEAVVVDLAIKSALGCLLIIILLILSYWQQLKMEEMFLVNFARGFIQLILVAGILVIVFGLEEVWILWLILIVMCTFAALSTKQIYDLPNIFLIEWLSITVASIAVMLTVVLLNVIPMKGEYIIPMGGMVIANTMTITTIALERIFSEIKQNKGQIEAAISLGDSTSNAVRPIVVQGYRSGLIPTTNRVAVLGIVSIPGLMSGMIIGGENPLYAAVYQVLIFAMILSAGIIGEIIAGTLFLREFFNDRSQLNIKLLSKEISKKKK